MDVVVIGTVVMDITGRNLISGLPKTMSVESDEIYEAIADQVNDLIRFLRRGVPWTQGPRSPRRKRLVGRFGGKKVHRTFFCFRLTPSSARRREEYFSDNSHKFSDLQRA